MADGRFLPLTGELEVKGHLFAAADFSTDGTSATLARAAPYLVRPPMG